MFRSSTSLAFTHCVLEAKGLSFGSDWKVGFVVDLGMAFVDNWVVGKEKGCYWLSNDIVGLVGNLAV